MLHLNSALSRSTGIRRLTPTRTVFGAVALGAVLLGGGTTAVAVTDSSARDSHYGQDIRLKVTNPRPNDVSGRNGDFTVDIVATALNRAGNRLLSARHGY